MIGLLLWLWQTLVALIVGISSVVLNRNRAGIVVCSIVIASLSRGRSRGRGSLWHV